MFASQLDLQRFQSTRDEGELCGLPQVTFADPPQPAGACHPGGLGATRGSIGSLSGPHSNEDPEVSQYSLDVPDASERHVEPAPSRGGAGRQSKRTRFALGCSCSAGAELDKPAAGEPLPPDASPGDRSAGQNATGSVLASSQGPSPLPLLPNQTELERREERVLLNEMQDAMQESNRAGTHCQ